VVSPGTSGGDNLLVRRFAQEAEKGSGPMGTRYNAIAGQKRGAALCLFSTYWTLGFIIQVRLIYVIGPRRGILSRI
jgi:hypothetical protein